MNMPSSNKRPREEHISSSSKKPTLEILTPPPIVRQPATIRNVLNTGR
jgi:hypothetical protein